MKGISENQMENIKQWIDQFHTFGKTISDSEYSKLEGVNIPQTGFGIRFIDSSFDIVTQEYTFISFRTGRFGVRFSRSQKVEGYDNLGDVCLAYLQGQLDPAPFKIDTGKNQS